MLSKTRQFLLCCCCVLSTMVTSSFASQVDSDDSSLSQLGNVYFSKDSLSSIQQKKLYLEGYRLTAGEISLAEKTIMTTMINHLTPDATIQVEALQDQVWVYLQYLTDIDGDGVYEWLGNSQGQPLWDNLSYSGQVSNYGTVARAMNYGDTRTISAYDLFLQGIQAEENRSTTGILSLEEKPYVQSGDIIFCISFSSHDYLVQEEAEVLPSYYFTLDLHTGNNIQLLGGYAFYDVSPFEWYFSAVDFGVKGGYFSGFSPKTFSPDSYLTRAMILQSLYQYAQAPDTQFVPLQDVSENDWYSKACSWAWHSGLVQETRIRPEENVTREEILQFLYAYAQQSPEFAHTLGKQGDLSQYPDRDQVGEAYLPAVLWALGNGVVTGDTRGYLLPDSTATRAEACYIFQKFVQLMP